MCFSGDGGGGGCGCNQRRALRGNTTCPRYLRKKIKPQPPLRQFLCTSWLTASPLGRASTAQWPQLKPPPEGRWKRNSRLFFQLALSWALDVVEIGVLGCFACRAVSLPLVQSVFGPRSCSGCAVSSVDGNNIVIGIGAGNAEGPVSIPGRGNGDTPLALRSTWMLRSSCGAPAPQVHKPSLHGARTSTRDLIVKISTLFHVTFR